MIELYLIKLFLRKETYSKYRNKLVLKDEDKELRTLYSVLDELMEKYDRDISFSEFELGVSSRSSENDNYYHLLDRIKEADVKEDMLQDMLKTMLERQTAYSLALLSIEVSEGRKPLSDVFNYLSSVENTEEKTEEETFVTDDIEELYNETVHKPGLRWRLRALNESMGSLRKGDFGFLFARPETGKTTFLASEITHFASQVDGPIVWFNNEEGGYKVKTRIMQAALGCTLSELFHNRELSHSKYMKLTKGNIKLRDSSTISKREVERICRELKPKLIVFDQIDKIKGFDNDREDLRLGSIYIWARELAKSYCPVIGVCQADVTGEGKKWLTMDNVANAKTSKQAEADWILGIGAVHDEGLKYVRYLHLSKNKLSGDEDTLSELRHGRMEVLIHPDLARYKDF